MIPCMQRLCYLTEAPISWLHTGGLQFSRSQPLKSNSLAQIFSFKLSESKPAVSS
ncbi:hypothetical protein M758_6G085700 [Ceratodon purpureus]|nr:hypothetical protein M758_6G085700 [Ceratodon purpureus]